MKNRALVGVFALVLASCGGGGGGESGGGGTITYTGLTTPVDFAANTKTAGTVVADYMDMNLLLTSDLNAGVFSAPGTGASKRSIQAVQKSLHASIAAIKRSVAVVQEFPFSCDSGSGNTVFNGNPDTMIGTMKTTYDSCLSDGILLQGSVKLEGFAYSYPNYTDLKITYNLTTSGNGVDVTLAGTLAQTFDGAWLANAALNMVERNNVTGQMWQYKNVVFDHGVITGKLFNSELGYIDITTPQALDLNKTGDSGRPVPEGQLVLSGADSFQLKLSPEGPTYSMETIPGESESYRLRWAIGLYQGAALQPVRQGWNYIAYSGWTPPPSDVAAQPVLRLRDEGQWAAVGTTAVLDASITSDGNGDLMHFSWELISKPAASALTLGSEQTAVLSVTPDVSGRYVFRLTVDDGTAPVQKLVNLDSYVSSVLSGSGDDIPTALYVFDEKHQRILKLVPGATPVLQAIALDNGAVSELALPDAVAYAGRIALSANGDYLALGTGTEVSLLNADTLAVIRSFSLTEANPGPYASIDSIKVSNTGTVYLSYQSLGVSNYVVTVLEIDMSASPATFQTFSWGDDGNSFPGYDSVILALDEARQRLVIRTAGTLRSASTATRALVAFQPGVSDASGSAWYLANSGVVADRAGNTYPVDTLEFTAGTLQGVSYLSGVVASGVSGALWFGTTPVNGFWLGQVETLAQTPELIELPWSRHADSYNDQSKAYMQPALVFLSGDGLHQYWIARDFDLSTPNPTSIVRFVRY